MENVNDIVREMRNVSRISHSANTKLFADRLDAAYKRDLQAMVDAGEIDMRTAIGEVDRLRDSLAYSAKTIAEYRDENARLKAALKPVLDCSIEKFMPGYEMSAVEPFYTSSEFGVEDAEGSAIQDESIATALNAIRAAQRICNGGAK